VLDEAKSMYNLQLCYTVWIKVIYNTKEESFDWMMCENASAFGAKRSRSYLRPALRV
jgi:hypothetical protein